MLALNCITQIEPIFGDGIVVRLLVSLISPVQRSNALAVRMY